MASSPITSWQTDGEKVDTVTDSILGGSKITGDNDCSHDIKRHLLLGKKVMTNLVVVAVVVVQLPSCVWLFATPRLLIKVHIVKAMVFLVVMYRCESWTIKKPECQKFDAFKLRCWRRLLRVPWAARRSNQSILKVINPDNTLEGLMLMLKLQYFG